MACVWLHKFSLLSLNRSVVVVAHAKNRVFCAAENRTFCGRGSAFFFSSGFRLYCRRASAEERAYLQNQPILKSHGYDEIGMGFELHGMAPCQVKSRDILFFLFLNNMDKVYVIKTKIVFT